MKGKEFWKVAIQSKQYDGEHYEFYVMAYSITEAEKKGLAQARTEATEVTDYYCQAVTFVGYIYGSR
jgi:hypothetical protein